MFFEACTGLKVKWENSSLYPIKDVTNIQTLADILGCGVGKFPTTYLGMCLGNAHKDLKIWDNIFEKFEKRLARWKAQYISFGGRHILINSVLDSLPTYISLFSLYRQKWLRNWTNLGEISFGMAAKRTKDTIWSSTGRIC